MSISTFGKSDIGATGFTLSPNIIYTCRFALPEYGSPTRISWYGRNKGDIPDYCKLGIYDINGILKAQTEETLIPNSLTNELHHFNISQTEILAPGTYDVVFGWWRSSAFTAFSDVGSLGQTKTKAETYTGSLPTSIVLSDFQDWAISVYVTYTPTTAPPVGTLEVHAYEDSVEVGASIEIVGVDTLITPFNIDLDVGNYTLNGSYGAYPTQTELAGILEGQLTVVNFVFTTIPPLKHILTVNSTPIEGIPFTLEKV